MKLFYGNQWWPGEGRKFHSQNPSTGEVLASGREPVESQLGACLQSAVEGAESWRRKPFDERLACLRLYKQLLEQHKEEMADLICRETSKVLWECKTELAAAMGKIEISIQAYEERCPSKQWEQGGMQAAWQFKPLGPLLVLGPFNFPLHLPNGHLIPALLAGNSVILKPSEFCPLIAEYNVKLLAEAGLGEAVNLLYGGVPVINKLIDDERLRGVLFTGSYAAGRQIHKRLAGRPEVMLALEMGGNNPLLVWDQEDTPAAVFTTIMSAFLTSGQRCVCARRLIIEKGAAGDHFLQALIEAVKKLRYGDPLNEDYFMGPLIHEKAAQQMSVMVERLEGLGAKCLMPKVYEGSLAGPQILDMQGCSYDPDEEVFAPLLKVYRSDSFEQALHLANKTDYGLAAGLISAQEDLFRIFQSEIRAGIVNWNRQITGAFSSSPFGGAGHSGNYRPGEIGRAHV